MIENRDRDYRSLEEIGIDVPSAIARFANKEELFRKTIRRFATELVRDGMKDFPEMKEPLQMEEFKRYIHSLKGVAGNLSMISAYELLQEFDQKLKEEQAEETKYRNLCHVMMEQANVILATLEEREDTAASGSGSHSEYIQLLEELERSLEMAKAKECETVMKKLKSRNWDGVVPDVWKQVEEAVEEYDYETALQIIMKLKHLK